MALLAAWLGDTMHDSDNRSVFLPGATTDAHHQIELACNACHTDAFTDKDQMQTACESCHLDQLKAAKDDHPKAKFKDPRNADRVEKLDARYCVTCHFEHRPEITGPMGVTLPADFCFVCHEKIADDRPSHEAFGFDTCASAGCHNFHDNRALYEDFLLKHAKADTMRKKPRQAGTPNLDEIAQIGAGYPLEQYPWKPLEATDIDVAAAHAGETTTSAWLASAHARSGVNCSACHATAEQDFVPQPGRAVCVDCHQPQVDTFLLGKHGMRLNHAVLGQELSPMKPALARLPMHDDAPDSGLGCSSCHTAHRYDTEYAATAACLECHADDHSTNFAASPHARAGIGMTCATCHMPVADRDVLDGAISWTFVDHHQSRSLRPNEKMLRPVCMRCHGLGFSTNALGDAALIANNFSGQPRLEIRSIQMAVDRLARIRRERELARSAAPQTPSNTEDQ